MTRFFLSRVYSDASSSASVFSDQSYPQDGHHICCALEGGPKERVPAGEYRLVILPIGSSPMDETYAKRFDPIGYQGVIALAGVKGFSKPVEIHAGDPKVDTSAVTSKGTIRLAWHVIKGTGDSRYRVPADDEVKDDLEDHGDAFIKAYRLLYAALASGECALVVREV